MALSIIFQIPQILRIDHVLTMILCLGCLVIQSQENLTLSDLSGSGNRPVYASDDGSLITGITKYLSIPASAFHPTFDDNLVDWISDPDEAYFTTNASSSADMIAPINLPHGSIIKKITTYYVDSDINGMVRFRMGYFDNTSSSSSSFPTTQFNSSGGGTSTKDEPIGGLNIEINNIDRAYYYTMYSCFPGLDCSVLNANYKIRQVVIEYVE